MSTPTRRDHEETAPHGADAARGSADGTPGRYPVGQAHGHAHGRPDEEPHAPWPREHAVHHAPTREDVAATADRLGLDIPPDQIAAYHRMLLANLDDLAQLPRMPGASHPVAPPAPGAREAGHPPRPEENTLNAWVWRAVVQERANGPLADVRVALKDNIALAGVPMTAGSPLLQGHVPEVDATVVRRLLQAGARILGKAACEDLCFSGGSHTAASGPVPNPHDPTRMAGGSSSGPVALVAAGEVDLGVGTEQGGSIVVPASWCGVLGLKPTHGLVPYTGSLGIEPSVDHIGFFARDVALLERALEATAGPDGLDPRQGEPPTLPREPPRADGWRVALLQDGFDWPDGISDARVDALVRDEVRRRLGQRGGEAHVPLHRHGPQLNSAVTVPSVARAYGEGSGVMVPHRAPQSADLADAFAAGRDARADELAPTVKLAALTGTYLRESLHDTPYAAAQNLRRELRAQVDASFERADLLAMPSAPYTAPPMPAPDAPPDEVLSMAFHGYNATPFDMTGHPTLSLPAGELDGLPVGALLVAPHGGEWRLLSAARDWMAAAG